MWAAYSFTHQRGCQFHIIVEHWEESYKIKNKAHKKSMKFFLQIENWYLPTSWQFAEQFKQNNVTRRSGNFLQTKFYHTISFHRTAYSERRPADIKIASNIFQILTPQTAQKMALSTDDGTIGTVHAVSLYLWTCVCWMSYEPWGTAPDPYWGPYWEPPSTPLWACKRHNWST